MTIQGGANLYTQGFGSHFENVEIPFITNRAPTSSDINYPVGKRWINMTLDGAYELTSFSSSGGTLTANWTFLAQAAGSLATLTTGDSTVVVPSVGNINILGTSGVSTTGSGSTVTIAISTPLIVADGGTGAQTLTNHGILLGQGTSAVAALGVGATGTVLTGVTGANPAFSGSPSVSGSIIAGTGVTATTGGVTATAGGLTATAGGLTVTAGGAAITGTTTINTTGNANTTIGNAAGSNTITINTGSGNFSLTGNANTIGIGNDAAANTINIGSTTVGSGIVERVGTGNYSLDGAATSTYTFAPSTTSGTINFGGTGANIGTMTIAGGTGAQEIDIANSTGGKTVNIATGAGNNTTVIGSTSGTSTTTIKAGSGNINLSGKTSANNDITATSGNISATSGSLSAGTTVTATLGNVTATNGNLVAGTAGNGLVIRTGNNARIGLATLIGGTITIANTSYTANSRLFLTMVSPGGSPGFPYLGSSTPGVNFVIASTSGTDTSTYAWMLVEIIAP